MNKVSRNESGFTLIEGLLVILILIVISGIGYMVYHDNHKSKPVSVSTTAGHKTVPTQTTTPPTTPPTTPVSPYAGWQSYTLPKEKLTFRYPATGRLRII